VSTWPLPAYELAIMAAVDLRARGVAEPEVSVVTPEERPLGVFGGAVADTVAELLQIRGIDVRTHTTPLAQHNGALRCAPGFEVPADRVVALPRLEGPALGGVAHDAHGFIPVDEYARVAHEADVYAAGDITSFPVKQGGIAAQQADVAAAAIAETAGAPVTPEPFRPVLRGLLLTGMVPRYLRADATGESVADTEPLWWPPAKIAGHHLAPFLARGLVHSA
jgi:sulfide:quinone oxidoreductase